MSTSLAVICEDPTNDRYIVKPVLSQLLRHLGKPRATITMVDNPRIRGDEQVIANAAALVTRFSKVADAVVFVLDQDREDGRAGRRNKRTRLSNAIAAAGPAGESAVPILAVQEVEVWALWGARSDLQHGWDEVRDERDPKEMYFKPLLKREDQNRADGGRTRLIDASLEPGWGSISGGCSELARAEAEIASLV